MRDGAESVLDYGGAADADTLYRLLPALQAKSSRLAF